MKNRIFLTNSGIIPPFPEVGTAKKTAKSLPKEDVTGLKETETDTKSDKSKPSRLLSLIRFHEKKAKGDEDYEESIEEIVDLYNHLIAVYSRCGLLRGDTEKADDILSKENNASKWGGVDGKRRGSKKGKRGKKDNSDDLRIKQLHEGVEISKSSASKQQDEALIFIAILRIFTTNTSNDETCANYNTSVIDEDQALLISLSAELCLAIIQSIKLVENSDICCLAEYELLAQSGKAILAGLVNIMNMVESDMRASSGGRKDDDCLTLLDCNAQTHVLILNSSIKLTCSLISLFGIKLSRSTALLIDLNTIAWKFLTIDDDSVQSSAARLLSCLPLAGGIERKTPSEIWSTSIEKTLTALSIVLQTVTPLVQSNTKSSDRTANDFLEQWICFVRKTTLNEPSRLRCFYRFCRGLTNAIHFFLLQDKLDRHHSNSSLVNAQVDIKLFLGIVESLVSFPLSSETVFYRTKRTLRDERIDNGLLSPRIIATEVANYIKLMGHDILDCILAAVGGPTLLPYARRIFRISYASILTSSSSPVRKVMDPTSAMQLKGKKRRWLHLSVTSRKVAINTFGSAIIAFGCDYCSSSRYTSRQTPTHLLIANTDSEKAITLIVGCLVEQISDDKSLRGDYDDDWGTHLERVELISASASCLSKSIVSCGGFMSMPIRSLIDSVVVNGLSQMGGTSEPSTQLLCWPSAKTAFLQLACTCVTTPWQDGSSSALVDLLITTANAFKHDMDREVSLNAIAALRICDTIAVPRAPALKYVARASSAPSTEGGIDLGSRAIVGDAASLAANIKAARKDTVLERKRIQEIEIAKKRKDEERLQREEKENHIKTSKRQRASINKKSEEIKNSVILDETSKELATTTPMEGVVKTEPEARDATHSAKPDCAANKKQEITTKQIPAEDIGDENSNDVNEGDQNDKEDKVEMDEDKMGNNQEAKMNSEDNSDDEALPDIFDGEPDSDDE